MDLQYTKQLGDGASILTAFGAFFKVIPWPEIAGFLSCLWLLTRLYEYVRGKCSGTEKNHKNN